MIELVIHYWLSLQDTGSWQLQLDVGRWYWPNAMILFILGQQSLCSYNHLCIIQWFSSERKSLHRQRYNVFRTIYDIFTEHLLNIFIYLWVTGKCLSSRGRNLLSILAFTLRAKRWVGGEPNNFPWPILSIFLIIILIDTIGIMYYFIFDVSRSITLNNKNLFVMLFKHSQLIRVI